MAPPPGWATLGACRRAGTRGSGAGRRPRRVPGRPRLWGGAPRGFPPSGRCPAASRVRTGVEAARVSSEGTRPIQGDLMQVVVLVKYVPEPQGTPTLGDAFLLVREGVEGALDPGDEHPVEAALQLVEAHGGEARLVSMGPEVAMSAIRRGLSMGAPSGVPVADPALGGA